MFQISVIIPTIGRGVLLDALHALKAACALCPGTEIILVDDTKQGTVKNEFLLSDTVIALASHGRGPAAARNLGIDNAHGEILIFIGDDIIVSENFLEEHLRFYQEKEGDFCVIGKVVWDRTHRISPVMQVIEDEGVWFHYATISDPARSYQCFYTSNVSLRRKTLGGLRFDEDFPYAGFEDTYLGYLLQKKGVQFFYNPQALAVHRHYSSLRDVHKRTLLLERSKNIMLRKLWPEDREAYHLEFLLQNKPFRYRIFIRFVFLCSMLRLFWLLDFVLRVYWQNGKRNWVYTTVIYYWSWHFFHKVKRGA